MPELPEVETVVQDLQEIMCGRTMNHLAVNDQRLLTQVDYLPESLAGRSLTTVTRRGKYICYDFEGRSLIQHLRMTGKMLPVDSPHVPHRLWREPVSPQIRCIFELAAGGDMVFFDVRRFGTLDLVNNLEAYFEARDLAPDMINAPDKARVRFHERIGQSQRAIKAGLLDQRAACGVGNIYADEGLHQARIHPETPGAALSPARADNLFDAVSAVMQQAIDKRGTSMSDYLDVNGNPGVFKKYLNVYGRAGDPCKSCAEAAIEKRVIGGRSSHFCPQCQRPDAVR